jgi:hypothetical protein
VYRSAAPAVSAVLDPADVDLLDMSRVNNSRVAAPRGSSVATSGAARWSLWLQDLLLSWASLV